MESIEAKAKRVEGTKRERNSAGMKQNYGKEIM